MRILCVASGESLTLDDLNFCKGKVKTYAVSDVYKLAPWADLLYSADHGWWSYHNGAPRFNGEKWTCDRMAANEYNLNRIRYSNSALWSHDRSVVASGGNSGFQCMNLADLHGATEIILLGYDYGFKHKKHFFGGHPPQINRHSNYADWLRRLKLAQPFINARVINCTPNSNIDFFERANIRDVLL